MSTQSRLVRINAFGHCNSCDNVYKKCEYAHFELYSRGKRVDYRHPCAACILIAKGRRRMPCSFLEGAEDESHRFHFFGPQNAAARDYVDAWEKFFGEMSEAIGESAELDANYEELERKKAIRDNSRKFQMLALQHERLLRDEKRVQDEMLKLEQTLAGLTDPEGKKSAGPSSPPSAGPSSPPSAGPSSPPSA